MSRKYDYRRDYNLYRDFHLVGMDRERDSIYSIPFWIGLLVITVLWGIFGVVYLADAVLPTALEVSDEVSHNNTFISGTHR